MACAQAEARVMCVYAGVLWKIQEDMCVPLSPSTLLHWNKVSQWTNLELAVFLLGGWPTRAKDSPISRPPFYPGVTGTHGHTQLITSVTGWQTHVCMASALPQWANDSAPVYVCIYVYIIYNILIYICIYIELGSHSAEHVARKFLSIPSVKIKDTGYHNLDQLEVYFMAKNIL